jgi:hypothetical protein
MSRDENLTSTTQVSSRTTFHLNPEKKLDWRGKEGRQTRTEERKRKIVKSRGRV